MAGGRLAGGSMCPATGGSVLGLVRDRRASEWADKTCPTRCSQVLELGRVCMGKSIDHRLVRIYVGQGGCRFALDQDDW